MRRTRGWTGLLPMVFALGLVAATAGAAGASQFTPVATSTQFGYNTIGSTIDPPTSGNPLISFIPVTGSVTTPSNLPFGTFQVSAPAAGQTTTYTNTPFSINLSASTINGTGVINPNAAPVKLTGVLNGTISAPDQSNVIATFNPMSGPTFTTGYYDQTLAIPNSPLNLVPSTVDGGMTSAQAGISTMTNAAFPSPEPSTIALFAVTIVGLGARRRMLRSRAV